MGKRLILGILKGLVLGGAVGALLHFALGLPTLTGVFAYLLYAGVGMLAGVFGGRAPWKPGAWIAAILKGVFGLAVGAGLYALGSRFLPTTNVLLPAGTQPTALANIPLLFAPIVALLYGTFVELDDGGDQPEEEASSGVRVGKISVEDIDVGEDEAEAAKASKSTKKA